MFHLGKLKRRPHIYSEQVEIGGLLKRNGKNGKGKTNPNIRRDFLLLPDLEKKGEKGPLHAEVENIKPKLII